MGSVGAGWSPRRLLAGFGLVAGIEDAGGAEEIGGGIRAVLEVPADEALSSGAGILVSGGKGTTRPNVCRSGAGKLRVVARRCHTGTNVVVPSCRHRTPKMDVEADDGAPLRRP